MPQTKTISAVISTAMFQSLGKRIGQQKVFRSIFKCFHLAMALQIGHHNLHLVCLPATPKRPHVFILPAPDSGQFGASIEYWVIIHSATWNINGSSWPTSSGIGKHLLGPRELLLIGIQFINHGSPREIVAPSIVTWWDSVNSQFDCSIEVLKKTTKRTSECLRRETMEALCFVVGH